MADDMRSFVVICLLVGLAAGTTTKAKSSTTKQTTTVPKSTQSTPASTTPSIEEICAKLNTSCKDCVGNSKCLYCKSDSSCIKYPVGDVIPRSGCSLSDARWGVCWVNFEALLIAAGVIGGVILISIILVIYCCCCRSKGGKRNEKEDAKYETQKMERKVKQDERRTERKGRLDEIRRKYGLVKDDSPYNRFDA